ncbi:MAG: hypothetical protein ACM31C_30025 [Acidobacteriota bacterium]
MARRRAWWSVAIASTLLLIAASVRADLENQQRGGEGGVFTSTPDRIGLVVPRGWHATDQASYPGVLLWMLHAQPEARIVLTAQPFTHKLYCSWDAACRNSHDALPTKLACALSAELKRQRFHVGTIQAGPKENEASGIPSVWFEYDDADPKTGKGHFLRQAVTLTEDRAITLLLSTSSSDARASYVRAFEQVLRTLHPLTAEEQQAAPSPAPTAPPGDAGVPLTLADAAVPTSAPTFPSAPAAQQSPVGPCP